MPIEKYYCESNVDVFLTVVCKEKCFTLSRGHVVSCDRRFFADGVLWFHCKSSYVYNNIDTRPEGKWLRIAWQGGSAIVRTKGEVVYRLADEKDVEIVVVCNGRRQYLILDAEDKRVVVSSVVIENNREYGVLSLQSCLKLDCCDPDNESYLLLKDERKVHFVACE